VGPTRNGPCPDKGDQLSAGREPPCPSTGILACPLSSRSVTEPNEVLIDLEFCDQTAAQAFLPQLEKIMNSPQAQAQLVRHSVPLLYAVVTDRVPSATG